MVKDQFIFNNEILEAVISIGNRHATVMDHAGDALSEKFRDYPHILANLFLLRPGRMPPDMAELQQALGSWSEIVRPGSAPERIGGFILSSEPNGAERRYVIRFIGDPVAFYKYTVGGRSAICGDPNVCPVKRKHGIEPQLRYAVNLIDRADRRLYMAEVPPCVVKPVAVWGKRNRCNPGGRDANDFSITVRRYKGTVRYQVTTLGPSALREEERNMPLFDLRRLFEPTPVTRIEEVLFGTGKPF